MELNKENLLLELMKIFSSIEKSLAENFVATHDGNEIIEYIQPFYFESVNTYLKKYLPEQADIVYPIFFSDIDTVPQFNEAFLVFMKTILNTYKKEKSIDLKELRNTTNKLFKPNQLLDEMSSKYPFDWNKVKILTDELVEKSFEENLVLAENLLENDDIEETYKDLKGQINKNDVIKYLSRVKIYYIFLTYIIEKSGNKGFFDYIAKNLMYNIVNGEHESVNMLLEQINILLKKKI